MNLANIVQLLEDASVGTQGRNLFAVEMPTGVNEGILIMPPYHGAQIDQELPGWREPVFRITVRSVDYGRGYALAERASAALTIRQDTAVNDWTVRRCLPLNDPRPYRRSVGGYWEFEVDVEIVYIVT